jgi:integrase
MPIDRLYWEILIRTGVRAEAIRSINLNENFKIIDGWHVIYGKSDKKTGFEFAIPDELFYRCERMADCDGNVFDFSYSTAQNRFKTALREIGLSDDEFGENGRNLVLHSLRKVSGDKAMAITDNLSKVQKHLRHSSPVYTSNLYLGKATIDHGKDLSLKISFGNTNTDLDNSLREALRDNGVNYDVREVLLGLNDRTKKEILNGLGKIIKLAD